MRGLIDQQQAWPPAGGHRCLVADIGGTHARFALSDLPPPGAEAHTVEVHSGRTFRVRDFDSIERAIQTYLEGADATQPPRAAVLAVASAVTGDRVSFTNNAWDFSISALRRHFGLGELEVVNDFAALASAVPALGKDDVAAVGPLGLRPPAASGMRVVLGPGTGLGVGAVQTSGRQSTVFETEGGHIALAVRDDAQIDVLRRLMQRFGRVSCERVLSGDGLLNLYIAICDGAGVPPQCATQEEVSAAAAAGDVLAAATTRMFCRMFGAFAGDAALMYCAWDGVFLAGGLVPHLLDDEGAALFREGFEDKGRFAPLLRETPTLRITRPDAGNLGAALVAARLQGVTAEAPAVVHAKVAAS
jgi:glucokinase